MRINFVFIVVVLLVNAGITGCGNVRATESPTTTEPPAMQQATQSPTEQPTETVAPAAVTPTVVPTATEPPATQTSIPTRTATPTQVSTATQLPPTVTPTHMPTATMPPTATAPTALPPLTDVLTNLEGLSLDDFLEESYKQLIRRSPERLTELGVSRDFGLRNDRLDDLSDAYLKETQVLEAAVLDMLRGYERSELSPEQQVSYDVYEWYLDNLVSGHAFLYHDYPLNHFLNSYHWTLNDLLTSKHPLNNREDVEDYVMRLSLVDDQVEQLLEGIAIREELGLVPPEFIIYLAKQDILHYLGTGSADAGSVRAPSLPVYTVLDAALTEMDGLSAEEKQAFREAALTEIRASFVPAYVALLQTLDHLKTVATSDAGVWKLPDGDAYYAHMLRRETNTDLTADEVHELGLAEVARTQAELRAIFDELGYPEGQNVGELIRRALNEGGTLPTSQVVSAYEQLLADMDQRTDQILDLRPEASVVVIGETSFGGGGGYYSAGSADGSRPGAFHAGVAGQTVLKAGMPTIAYHEAIPGHHTQIALAQELDLPTFRNDTFFNGHGEGWALYAERLAWELGLYDGDPYGNVGRLQLELLRAARMVVDTGIHAKGWTREQARAYLQENVGGWTHEVERYVVWPGQATGYMVGMLKILELRQRAMDQLGKDFDIKEFHNVVIGNGSLPLDILERLVDDYITTKLN